MDEVTRLARAARAGDREALTGLVAATYDDVWRFCASVIGRQDADDVAQMTYVQVVRSLPGFRGRSSARTWMLGIARHVCMDELRVRERTRRRDQLCGAGPEPRGADPAERVSVADLVRQLDPDRRAAFVLTQLLGLSYDEAARACDCPVGTIRSRVARARSDLLRLTGSEVKERDRPHGTDRSAAG